MLHRLKVFTKKLILPKRIEFAIRKIASPVIIEVGANDGSSGDPIHSLIKKNVTGRALLIEPIPYLFDRLRNAYAGRQHVSFENVAISNTCGTSSIYFIDASAAQSLPGLPAYFEELASFDRDSVAKTLGPDGQQFLREHFVKTVPLTTLLDEHAISRVDLLQIDTEGHDLEVLKTFPFDRLKPKLVCFEHSHLSEADHAIARSMMTHHGYKLEKWGKDYVCLH